MKKISLVVPVFYEEEVIRQFLKETKEQLDLLQYDYEYIFVDDGSTDKTVQIIKEYAQNDNRIKLVVLSYNHGKAFAATAGFSYASGDYVIYMDPDLQDPPKEIPNLLNEIQKGYDLVWGIREEKKDSNINRVFSAIFWRILNKYTGLEIPKGIAVMRIFTKEFNQQLLKYNETNRFVEGLFYHVGMNTSVLKISQRERFAGTSKFNFKRKLKLAFDAIFDFSELPLKISVKIGIIISILGFISLIFIFLLKIFIDFQTGWPSLVSLIIFSLGLQLSFLGIVSLYIGRIYKEVKNRPLFSVKERINL